MLQVDVAVTFGDLAILDAHGAVERDGISRAAAHELVIVIRPVCVRLEIVHEQRHILVLSEDVELFRVSPCGNDHHLYENAVHSENLAARP